MSILLDTETICAIATPYGKSAIGVVKLSGPQAFSIFSQVFKRTLTSPYGFEAQHRHAQYGWIVDPSTLLAIDDVIALAFCAPHSYTGDDTIEISCHGSPLILNDVMRLLIAAGARTAQGGEFTKRAFANGKMDLSQAEAVADLIASNSQAALRMSLAQMRGHFSQKINTLRDTLIRFCSLIELELDFSEEEIEFADRVGLLQDSEQIISELQRLRDSYDKGNIIKNGIPITIAGATNAGKSTLLNALLDDERAIVSEIHGTTRDAIEDTLNIGGREFRLIDTAGLRTTSDPVESIGIAKSYDKITQALLTLWVIDATTPPEHLGVTAQEILQRTQHNDICALINKRDLATPQQLNALTTYLTHLGIATILSISAQDARDIDTVKETILFHFHALDVQDDEIIVSNLRHANALSMAITHLTAVREGLQHAIPNDLLAQDLRLAINALSEITGKISSDTILHTIFATFCIGK